MSVFHLKYRPQRISDLDLLRVGGSLTKILKSKDTPQAFLFSGPKGSGKTSAARIMARAVNCLKPQGVEPCNICENCEEISRGSSMDIIEIDAASNRGIDDIRVLKDRAYLLPSKLKQKVFIIDEVHMLTKEAFNAMLKLIEEPPKNTIFILCTTDPQKIPETVLSRLMRVDFGKGAKKELVSSLKKIIIGEGIEIDDKTIDLLVSESDGSFRNLQRKFNELYLQLGNKITYDKAKKYMETISGEYGEKEICADLVLGDGRKIMERLEKMAGEGADFSVFREKLLEYLQKRLVAFFENEVGLSEDTGLGLKEVSRLINLLIAASKQEKEVNIDQLPLQLAVAEFLGVGKAPMAGDSKVETTVVTETVLRVEEIRTEMVSEPEEREEAELKVAGGSLELEKVEKEWSKMLSAVKPFNHSVEAFLRAARPKLVRGKTLILEVFYPFHKDRLEEAKNRKVVEMGLSKVYGVDMAFECVLSKGKKEPLVIKNDTPLEAVSSELSLEKNNADNSTKDIYEVAKEIFG
ncbi:MAG: DNA polymerase III subunit gamma/tau [Candidatus Shapirobacteria bacterium]|jgi:DNA polymerase-3 subunit gamma/tau